MRRALAFRHRASDPGGRLATFGRVTWVHCPECNKAAKSSGQGVTCKSCGYTTIQKRKPHSSRWASIATSDPRCSGCRRPLIAMNRPTGFERDRKLFVRVRCPNCCQTFDYPARYGWSPRYTPERKLSLFLVTQVAGQTLWVENLVHLDALEEYLGASLRERGPVAGLTMMARLPAWMKASTNRVKVLRGLAQLRALAARSGIDE
jgi:hypothetical protein